MNTCSTPYQRCGSCASPSSIGHFGGITATTNPIIRGIGRSAVPSGWPAGKVFAYVLTTVNVVGGYFVQSGSAPNLQGGFVTLATCMHYHRTMWASMKGLWVAGFAGKNIGTGNPLFYLMYAADECDSQLGLWNTLPPSTRTAKNAKYNVLGDLYEPSTAIAATRHTPGAYHPPHPRHVHAPGNAWHTDIDYGHFGRRPKLLIGDPNFSFVWMRPRYSYIHPQHPRFTTYDSLGAFLRNLR